MGILVVALLIALIIGLLLKFGGRGWRRAGAARTAELRRRLVRRVMGDEATADRLIAHECRLRPWLSERELLVAALGRFGQDRR